MESLLLPLLFVKHPSVIKRFNAFCKAKKIKLTFSDLVFEKKYTNDIGEFKGGDSKLTKDYIHKNADVYPIYSAATDIKTQGISGYVNTYMYEDEAIHITKNDEKTGTVFFIEKQKHSLNGDRAIFIVDAAEYVKKYVYRV